MTGARRATPLSKRRGPVSRSALLRTLPDPVDAGKPSIKFPDAGSGAQQTCSSYGAEARRDHRRSCCSVTIILLDRASVDPRRARMPLGGRSAACACHGVTGRSGDDSGIAIVGDGTVGGGTFS